MSCSMRPRSHSCVQHAIQLLTANVPQQHSITRKIGTCGSMAVISAIAFSAGYLPTLVHAALLGFAVHLLIMHGNLLE